MPILDTFSKYNFKNNGQKSVFHRTWIWECMSADKWKESRMWLFLSSVTLSLIYYLRICFKSFCLNEWIKIFWQIFGLSPLRSRSPHRLQHSNNYKGWRESDSVSRNQALHGWAFIFIFQPFMLLSPLMLWENVGEGISGIKLRVCSLI